MNTKALIMSIAFVGFSITAFGQKSALNSAKSDYDSYTTLKAASPNLAEPKIKSAKEAIDKASQHDKTKNDPLTWTYRAMIYSDMAAAPNADPGLATEALNSLNKAKELDQAGANKANIERASLMLAQSHLVKGVDFYQKNNFVEAYKEFDKGSTYAPKDTTLNYYAGVAAMQAKDYKNAINKFKEVLPVSNFSNLENVYANLSYLYATQKDTAEAIRIAGEGASKFPKSSDLATREIEYSLMAGRQKEVIEKITAQMTKEPTNKLYPFYLGIAYNASNDTKKAEEAYKKAIEIDPNYSDAYTNIGGLIMNSGIDLYNAANKLPANKQTEYAAAMKKAQAEFDRAFPYLAKTVELNPKSEIALKNLKTYYTIKKNEAKVKEIDEKLKAL